MMTTKASGTVQEDNDITRVTHWHFPLGAETGVHKHELDYVVVPLTTGTLNIVDSEGTKTSSNLIAGISYFRNAGVEHNVINASETEFDFIEIEFK